MEEVCSPASARSSGAYRTSDDERIYVPVRSVVYVRTQRISKLIVFS
jgi:hypothetical protein